MYDYRVTFMLRADHSVRLVRVESRESRLARFKALPPPVRWGELQCWPLEVFRELLHELPQQYVLTDQERPPIG